MAEIKEVMVLKAENNGQTKDSSISSKQMVVDPFSKLYGQKNLVEPIYNMNVLLSLRESNPIHSACISAKVADIAGIGGGFVPKEGIESPSEDQYNILRNFLKDCNPEMTYNEVLRAVWDDYETLGWGIIEVVRDGTGMPVEIYHVPAHTMRAHKDGIRFAQYLNKKFRWFKKFGYEGDFHIDTGEPISNGSDEIKAGEVIVIRRFGSRSSYYGVPDYISSLGSIAGSQAVRDYNMDYFSGKTIPDAVLFLEGLEEIPQNVVDELKTFFQVETKGKHHKLAVVPIPEGGKATLEKITNEVKEASFRLYRQDNAIEICVAHRVPPYRIGWPIVGSLGGTSAKEMNEMYKRSVIEPGQEILEHRLNNQLFKEFEKFIGQLTYEFKMNDIDVEDSAEELNYAISGYREGIFTLDEARNIVGYEPIVGTLEQLSLKNGNSNGNQSQEPMGIRVYQNETNPIEKADDNNQALYQAYLNSHEIMEKRLKGKVTDFFGRKGNVS